MIALELCLTRVDRPGLALAAQALPWLRELHAELGGLPPAGVVADLGLLLSGQVRVLRPPAAPLPGLAATLRVYEDQLLARLLADSRLDDAALALAALPVALQPRGVALTIAGILGRLGWQCEPLPAASVRRQLGRGAQVLLEEGRAALLGEPAPLAAYQALGQAARSCRQLIGDRELFVLEHLASLDSSARRLAASQIVDAAEALEQGLPRHLRRRHAERGHAATQLEHDSAYPTGGFSSVTTSGTFENLVASELVYMERSLRRDLERAPVDLFDLRYAEGELLYYTRDEATFVRRRHEIVFVLAAELSQARVKDAELRWQRLVTAVGLVLCLVKRLVLALGQEALHLRLRFERELGAGDERALAEILFAGWRERGLLSIDEVPDVASALTEAHARARQALCDVIVLHVGGLAAPAPRQRPCARVASLGLQAAAPTLSDGDLGSEPWPAWQAATLELLERMI